MDDGTTTKHQQRLAERKWRTQKRRKLPFVVEKRLKRIVKKEKLNSWMDALAFRVRVENRTRDFQVLAADFLIKGSPQSSFVGLNPSNTRPLLDRGQLQHTWGYCCFLNCVEFMVSHKEMVLHYGSTERGQRGNTWSKGKRANGASQGKIKPLLPWEKLCGSIHDISLSVCNMNRLWWGWCCEQKRWVITKYDLLCQQSKTLRSILNYTSCCIEDIKY